MAKLFFELIYVEFFYIRTKVNSIDFAHFFHKTLAFQLKNSKDHFRSRSTCLWMLLEWVWLFAISLEISLDHSWSFHPHILIVCDLVLNIFIELSVSLWRSQNIPQRSAQDLNTILTMLDHLCQPLPIVLVSGALLSSLWVLRHTTQIRQTYTMFSSLYHHSTPLPFTL